MEVSASGNEVSTWNEFTCFPLCLKQHKRKNRNKKIEVNSLQNNRNQAMKDTGY